MERLSSNTTPSGISANALRAWGMMFLLVGVVGRGILQNHFLGLGQVSSQQLLEIMQSSDTAMVMATVSLVMQAMETCAVPIFALLLIVGVQKTSDFRAYLLRVSGAAVLTEIPYDLAISGKILDFSTRNPVYGMALSLVMLYFYRRYAQPGFKNVLIKVVVTLSALLWPVMLKIEFGTATVLIVCILWIFRRRPMYRNFAGATAAIVCSLTSPFFLASPMGFLAIHLYNGEKGDENRLLNYLAYPAMLLIAGIGCKFL